MSVPFFQEDAFREEPDGPHYARVRLAQGQLAADSTFVLRLEDAVYLTAENVTAVIKRGERAVRDLEALLQISTTVREHRELDALGKRLLALILETFPPIMEPSC